MRRSRLIYGILLLAVLQVSTLHGQVTGWAAIHEGTTGGVGGDTILVDSRIKLLSALSAEAPRIILIVDTILLRKGERINVFANDLSIIGINKYSTITNGGLVINGRNIIIQNLSIGDSYIDGHWDGKNGPRTDALTLNGQNIWIDHCDLYHSYDGLLDIGRTESASADFITISWTRFSNHNKVMLIGKSDNDTICRNHLRVTIHHCWFDGDASFYDFVDETHYRIQQRMPRVRFGKVHLFNNYYENVGDYCIAARLESDVVVESNYFRNLSDPHFRDDIGKGIRDPILVARNNIYDNVKKIDTSASEEGFNTGSMYEYELHETSTIPEMVMNNAGKFNRGHNNPPEAHNDSIILYQDQEAADLFPLGNDWDQDHDSIRISRIKNVPFGKTRIFANHIVYVPGPGFSGTDSIHYEIIDFEGGTGDAFIFINIRSPSGSK